MCQHSLIIARLRSAFMLADLGYDVWLGNLRGNTYSVGHENHQLNPNKTSFWRFS